MKAAKVPKDVRDYLSTFNGKQFSKQELLELMKETLGPERTNETSDVILKYTKTYVAAAPESKKESPSDEPSLPAQPTAP